MTIDQLRLSRRQFGACAGGLFASFAFGSACRVASESSQGNGGRFSARPHAGVKTTPRENDSAWTADAMRSSTSRRMQRQLPCRCCSCCTAPAGAAKACFGASARPRTKREWPCSPPTRAASHGTPFETISDLDVAFVDRALARVFETVSVDPARLAVGGFSDGASYALSLGLINGDLFGRVVAFSPGFEIAGDAHGRARFFISHGKADTVLPIDFCSRMIVPRLRTRGYDVTFREFNGGTRFRPRSPARACDGWPLRRLRARITTTKNAETAETADQPIYLALRAPAPGGTFPANSTGARRPDSRLTPDTRRHA